MLHRRVEIEKQDFRKKSSFPPNPANLKANLRLSPTKSEYWSTSKVDDYYLKEWITKSSPGARFNRRSGGPIR